MDRLEYVLTLAEERNMTRAAARLFITQPTLTSYINRLEQELGVKLFDRSVQPIEVTRAGLVYMEDMKRIRSRELALRAKLQALGQEGRAFSVGIPPVRGDGVLPAVTKAFLSRYPEVNLHVENMLEDALERELEGGRIDVAVGSLSTAYPDLRYECIREERFYLLVPRSFPCVAQLSPQEGTYENPYVIDGAALSGERILLPRAGGGQYRHAVLMMEKHGIVGGTSVSCGSLLTLYQLVGEGVGILFTIPHQFMQTYPKYTDKIAFCRLRGDQTMQKTYVAYHEDSANIALIRTFLALIRETYAQEKFA